MRAVARTTLALGDLLEVPVGIVPATGTQEIKFDTACDEEGAKREQVYVHPTRSRTLYAPPASVPLDELSDDEFAALAVGDMTAVEVPDVVTDALKGLRVGDTFHVVPPSELDYAAAATKLDAVELLEFIDYRNVPTDRLNGSFWIQPDPGFARPLATLMAAMRKDGKAMLVKWSVKSRQRLGVIRVRKTDDGDALLLNGIVFAADWRAADSDVLAPSKVEEVSPSAVAAALTIIQAHHGTGKALDEAEDDLRELLVEVVERAADGLYDDPARVLELASTYRGEDLGERADRLVLWAEARWPELAEKRKEVERVIAEGGEGVGEKLAAIVG